MGAENEKNVLIIVRINCFDFWRPLNRSLLSYCQLFFKMQLRPFCDNGYLILNFSGDHKKRAKYRFASKTLMRILPDKLKEEVEGLIASQTMTLDLYEILGQCTWGQAKSL